jgi:hypothetical protein
MVFTRVGGLQSMKLGGAFQAKEFEYDIVGHPQCDFQFTTCFPFHPATAHASPQVTIIREYCQGPNTMLYNLPTGVNPAD